MGRKANARIEEIEAEIETLTKKLDSGEVSSTERPQIALEIRSLLTEKDNITQGNMSEFQSSEKITLFNIVVENLRMSNAFRGITRKERGK